ncbi:NUDIX hydrolase [Fredinandcohnia quinoae]|uniref:NUDIX hydrolase n=1 Tax=Fredinandcohnia quinoae TaxID=2918902 RepID=A0AAW5ECV5_9BACI|nr:NUDIX hydrolase [Fredinandcohnia sp. SECRCQ15]MCH1627837.1 NUDIX hydrolase [Fredinandcohnia sp. SECRCQ15]
MSLKWLEWAKQIQAISQSGLAYSKDVYDIERFKELRNISAEIITEFSNKNLEEVKSIFIKEEGYQTPKVDIRAVVFQDDKILLVKEKSDNGWTLPGGWADIGVSPSENAVKEVEEESGYIVKPKRVLAVLDRNMHPHTPHIYHIYKIFFECEIVGGEAKSSVETSDVGFFAKDALPELSVDRVTESQIVMLFECKGREYVEVLFN